MRTNIEHRKFGLLGSILFIFLTGCTHYTPLDYMTPAEISALPDTDVCYWAVLGDTIALPEARRRALTCAPSSTQDDFYKTSTAVRAAQYNALSGPPVQKTICHTTHYGTLECETK